MNRGRPVLPEKINPIRFSTPGNFQLWLFFSWHSSVQKYKQFLLTRLALNKIHFPNRSEKRKNISIFNLKETDRKHQKKISLCYGFSHITEQCWLFVGIIHPAKKPVPEIQNPTKNLQVISFRQLPIFFISDIWLKKPTCITFIFNASSEVRNEKI